MPRPNPIANGSADWSTLDQAKNQDAPATRERHGTEQVDPPATAATPVQPDRAWTAGTRVPTPHPGPCRRSSAEGRQRGHLLSFHPSDRTPVPTAHHGTATALHPIGRTGHHRQPAAAACPTANASAEAQPVLRNPSGPTTRVVAAMARPAGSVTSQHHSEQSTVRHRDDRLPPQAPWTRGAPEGLSAVAQGSAVWTAEA